MANPLLIRWIEWTGTASDASRELSSLLPSIEPITLRNFQYYVERGTVTPATAPGKGRATYGRRQLLEALATRALSADGWKIGKIAEILPSYSEEALAELVQPSHGNKSVQPESPAVVLVKARAELDHNVAPGPIPLAPERVLIWRDGDIQIQVRSDIASRLSAGEFSASAHRLFASAMAHFYRR